MIIKKLRINRLPGFHKGLAEINELACNVNIVTGPNGSGKSSTARAIQRLIWWQKNNFDYDLNALVDINREINEIRIDPQGYLRTTANKTTHEDLSFVFPREFSNQYMLALHDLINGRDDNLAGIIAREVNGGIDLAKATHKLDYKTSIPNIAQPRYKHYLETQNELKKLDNEQNLLLKNEEKLTLLEEEREKAIKASAYKDLYEKVLNCIQAKNACNAIKQRLNNFSPAMRRLNEDDYTTVEALEKKLTETESAISDSENIIAEYNEEIDGLHISNTTTPAELITELSDRIENLKQIQQRIYSLEREISNQQVIKDGAGRLLSTDDDLNALFNLDLNNTHLLNELIQTANEAEGIHSNLLGEKRRLEKEIIDLQTKGNQHDSINDIRKAIIILSDWLKGAGTPSKVSIFIMNALVVWALFAILIGYDANPPLVITTVFISLLLIPAILLFQKKYRNKDEQLDVRTGDFKKLSLQPPTRWDSDSVSQRLQELIADLENHAVISRTREQLKKINVELEQSQRRLMDIKSAYFDLKEDVGMIPDNIDQLTNNYNSFYLFLTNASKWQDAAIEHQKLRKEKQNYIRIYADELGVINSILAKFDFVPVENHIQAHAILLTLHKESDLIKQIQSDIVYQENMIDLKVKEKERYQTSLQEIYHRLETPVGNREGIYLLSLGLKDMRETEEQLAEAMAMVNANEQLLISHALYHVYKESENEFVTAEHVQQKIEKYGYLSSQGEGIMQQISDIKAQIRERKSKDDIEKALSRKEDALDGLNELLSSNLKAITGDLIITHLHEEISLNNDNPVFKLANHILGNITGNRYKLILGKGRQPVFKAYDNKLNQIQSLDELSTGTRVQLLLAIRLAYIETQENHIKLPVLADELLANSDDERSESIIRSLIEVSRNRQLFYFTAQAEEVYKWEEYLAKCSNIEWKTTFLNI